MGTSILDQLGTNPPAKKSGGVSILDQVKSSAIPERNKEIIEEDNPIDQMTTKLGNLGSYLKSIALDYNNPGSNGFQGAIDVVKKIGHNIGTSADAISKEQFAMAFGGLSKSHPQQFTPGQLELIRQQEEAKKQRSEGAPPFIDQINPITLASGFVTSTADQIEKTVGSLTNSVNQNGVAMPATVEEQAQNLQTLAGTIAQVAAFKSVKSRVGGLPQTAEEAKALQKVSPVGKIVQHMAGEGLATSAAGATQGIIQSMGSPEQQEAAVAGAITYMPIGLAFGFLGRKTYLRELDQNFVDKVIKPSNAAIKEMAAFNDLRTRGSTTTQNIADRVDYINKSADLVEASLRDRLANNDGFVTYDLSHDEARNLADKVGANRVINEPNYQAIPKLDDKIVRDNKRNSIEFESPLDKVAYIAAVSKKRSSGIDSIIKDAIKQTGLSEQELINHGKNVRDAVRKGQPVPRQQYQLDEVNREVQAAGQEKINNSTEGDVISDVQGNQWIRKGDNLEGSNGLVYPVNSQEAHLILGRSKLTEAKSSPVIGLDKQAFNPNYGTEVDGPLYIYHSPANKSTVITKIAFNDKANSFFVKSGYFPGEVVSYGGKDHFIMGGRFGDVSSDPVMGQATKLLNSSTGGGQFGPKSRSVNKDFNILKLSTSGHPDYSVEFEVPSNLVRRSTGTLQSVTNAENFTRVGELTKNNYLESLWQKYYNEYKKGSGSMASFNQKFFTSNGVDPKDFSNVEAYFYNRLENKLSQDVLSKEEIATRARMKSNMLANDKVSQANLRDQLEYLASSNNMTFTPQGAGKYKLESLDKGWKAIVTSPDEAFEAINKVKQIGGYALDGGGTNVVNTAVGSTGGYNQPFKPKNYERAGGFADKVINKYERWYDQSSSNQFLSYTDPVVRRFASVDNASGGISDFLSPALDIQNAHFKKKATALRPEFKDLTNSGKDVLHEGKGLSEKERWMVSDYLETANADEIAKNSLKRPLNDFEKKFATTILGKVDVDELRTQMYAARKSANKEIGTPEYDAALINTIKDPALLKAARQLVNSGKKLGPDMFSPTTVLDYAEALNDPEHHLSREDFKRVHNLSDKQLAYAAKMDDYYGKAASIAGIDPKAVLNRYLPRIRNNVLAATGSVVPEGFARELEKFGITGQNIAERDPNELLRIYHSSLLNHISGFSDALGKANTKFQSQIDILKQQAQSSLDNSIALKAKSQYDAAKQEEIKARYYSKLSENMDDVSQTYLSDSRGIPNLADQTAAASSKFSQLLGLKSPEQNSVLQLFSLGKIALRPALAARDVFQTLGTVYISLGSEFAAKTFTGALSDEYMRGVQEKGIIPKLDAGSLIDPGSSGAGGISTQGVFKEKIQGLTESSYKLSGQELAYNRMLAGIYKATQDIGGRELKRLQAGIITKEEAYDNIGLTIHGPSIQRRFDELLSDKGRPDEALDFLGRWHGRYSATIFGMANNPSGWNNNFGRLLGQYGSWATNASHTILEQLARGNKKQITAKVLRAGVVMGAFSGVSSYTGLKLWNWAAGNPLATIPGVGPVISESQDLMQEWEKTGDPSAVMNMLGGDILGFIPYSQAFKDWKASYDLLNNGDARGLVRGFGVGVSR